MVRLFPLARVDTTENVEKAVGVSPWRYAWTWIQIILFPFVIWALYIFPPYQKPQKGLLNNWVFMFISMPLGSLSITMIYSYWGKVFLQEFYFTPVAACTAALLFLYYMMCEFYDFPVTLIGLLVPAVITLVFPVALYVRSVAIEKRKDTAFLDGFKSFSKFRLTIGVLFAVCCGYVILFNAVQTSPNLQRFLIFVFTLCVFLIKIFVQDFTRRKVPIQKSSLVTFWFEFFYEFFSTAVFPEISSPVTFVILIMLKIFSLNISLCLLTDWWDFLKIKALLFQRKLESEEEESYDVELAGTRSATASANIVPSQSTDSVDSAKSGDFLVNPSSNTSSRAATPIIVSSRRKSPNVEVFQQPEDAIPVVRSNTWDFEAPKFPQPRQRADSDDLVFPKKARMYQVLRRVVFSDLDHVQLKDYAVVNCLYAIASHVISPIYWVPMSYFLKYGYNSKYFIYHFFTDEQYHTSLIYAGISFGVSVTILICTYIIILKKFRIDYFQVSKAYVVEDKWFFIFSIASATCICWSMLSQQHNIAWNFYHKTIT